MKERIDMMSLNYDLCACCGVVIPEGRQICYKCAHEDDVEFQIKKRKTLEKLYGYDITEWNNIEVSPGYTEEEGRAALKDLLIDLRDQGYASMSQTEQGL